MADFKKKFAKKWALLLVLNENSLNEGYIYVAEMKYEIIGSAWHHSLGSN
jgi:hypothetical protein